MLNFKQYLKNSQFDCNSPTGINSTAVNPNLNSLRAYPAKKYNWAIPGYLLFKAILDHLAGLVLLIVLFPLLLFIALLIRLDSPGNPVFSQRRVGLHGRFFTAYKFRSMYLNCDQNRYRAYLKKYVLENSPYKITRQGEKIFKLADDPRITRMGSLLRKTNLDELPQLINIIRGDMSFIGPRPDVPFSVNLYSSWQRQRLAIKPGITGLWQVCHRKGLSFNDMVRLDLAYIERVSPLLDIKIFILTLHTILMCDGS